MRKIRIETSDIATLDVDAIVTVINKGQPASEGADAVEQAELLAAHKAIMDYDIGFVGIAPCFDLAAKYVISAVWPEWKDCKYNAVNESILRMLALAAENDCKSVALPLPSAGISSDARDTVWDFVITSCSSFLFSHPDTQIDIVFALDDDWLFYWAMQFFDDHGSLDFMDVDPAQLAIAELNEKLSQIVTEYFSGIPDNQHQYIFTEVPAPDEQDVRYIRNMREDLLDCVYPSWGYLPAGFDSKKVLGLMVNSIMRTLQQYDAQTCALNPQAWDKYGEYADGRSCFTGALVADPLRLVHVRSKREHWYIFWYVWSD